MVERKFDLYSVQAKTVNDAYQRGLGVADLEENPAPWIVEGLTLVEKEGRGVTREDMERVAKQDQELSSPDPWFQGFTLFKVGR